VLDDATIARTMRVFTERQGPLWPDEARRARGGRRAAPGGFGPAHSASPGPPGAGARLARLARP
jgi:hypothetical protein